MKPLETSCFWKLIFIGSVRKRSLLTFLFCTSDISIEQNSFSSFSKTFFSNLFYFSLSELQINKCSKDSSSSWHLGQILFSYRLGQNRYFFSNVGSSLFIYFIVKIHLLFSFKLFPCFFQSLFTNLLNKL